MKNEMNISSNEKSHSFFEAHLHERPEYRVIESDGHFEIRRYPGHMRAVVTLRKTSFENFKEIASEKLDSYVLGKNRFNAEMPVIFSLLQEQESNGEWTMSYVLSSEYNRSNVPEPLYWDVHLIEVESYEVAVLRFFGDSSWNNVKLYMEELKAWVARRHEIDISGEFFAAQYEGPFSLPFVHRNEVQVPVDLENYYGTEGF